LEFTLAFYKALTRMSEWADFRFAGLATGYRTRWIIPDVVREHASSGYRFFNVTCTSPLIFPLKAAVSIHTTGVRELERLILGVRTLPPDIALEWNGRTYTLCRCDPGALARMASLEALKADTPIIVADGIPDRLAVTVAGCTVGGEQCKYEGASRHRVPPVSACGNGLKSCKR
jgi:hypothetical protein